MKRSVRFAGVSVSAVVLSSAITALAAEQMSMPVTDTAKTKAAVSTSASDTAKLKPQTTCPIQGGPINKKLFVDYQGKRIYVCCEGCLAAVKKNPEKAIKDLAALGQGVETIASAKENKKAQVKPAAQKTSSGTSEADMKGMDMSGMDMSKDSSMGGMHHSK
jgi:YHS domain-containing protein